MTENSNSHLAAGGAEAIRGPTGRTASGWKLVPIEPTREMIEAAMKTLEFGWSEACPDVIEGGVICEAGISQEDADAINAENAKAHADYYRAMLAAAPSADKAEPWVMPKVPELFALINKTPILQSLLYDINLLPEQIDNDRHWNYMACICSAFNVAVSGARAADKPMAWLCEFMREDGTTDTQVLLEDPECTRWADCADGDGVSPYRVTPLYAAPPTPLLREAMEALDNFRDAVLNSRDALEEGTLNNDQANAVLSQFDNDCGAALAKLREQLKGTE